MVETTANAPSAIETLHEALALVPTAGEALKQEYKPCTS